MAMWTQGCERGKRSKDDRDCAVRMASAPRRRGHGRRGGPGTVSLALAASMPCHFTTLDQSPSHSPP
eukprot:2096829-Rhodomonas_salina.1